MRILIIEDDRDAAAYLVKAFREAGHIVDHAADGVDGYELAHEGGYDVAIVDRMLPKMDGLSLIGALRAQGNETPALILSALGQVDDRVKGLRAGGDDYLAKPYAFSELLARVEALARRRPKGAPEETVYRLGDLVLDRLSHKVDARGRGDRPAAARIPAARISDAERRQGGHPHHAARTCLGLSFRSADQCDRRPCLAAARQDRPGFRHARCCIRCAARDT